MVTCSDQIIETEESSDITSSRDESNILDVSSSPFRSGLSDLEESSVFSSLISPSDDSQHNELHPVTTNLSGEELQDQIDNILSQSTVDWKGTLDFPCMRTIQEIPKSRNILRFIGRHNPLEELASNLYFDPSVYTTVDGFKGAGFQQLVKDLQVASITTGGFPITKTGTTRLKDDLNGCFRLSCFRCQTYRGNRYERYGMAFRKLSFHNNRKNNRHSSGRNGPRRTNTQKAFHSSKRCPFFLLFISTQLDFM